MIGELELSELMVTIGKRYPDDQEAMALLREVASLRGYVARAVKSGPAALYHDAVAEREALRKTLLSAVQDLAGVVDERDAVHDLVESVARERDHYRDAHFAMIKRMGEVALDLEGPIGATAISLGKAPGQMPEFYVTQDEHRRVIGDAALRIAHLERLARLDDGRGGKG